MKNTSIKQMFTVVCSITGKSVKVRKPVYLKRIQRVKALVRARLGSACSTSEAVEILTTRYVSNEARKAHNVSFINEPFDVETPTTEVVELPTTTPEDLQVVA